MNSTSAFHGSEWIDAGRSTGYDGYYCSEIFSARVAELDNDFVAPTLRKTLTMLLV
ncbi:hypothetical protein J2X85_004193 [Microbacterium trichothecenolyticum]|uniref:hypothetical protein n=1 Tax=Microbacterium trichothecenolyticum TaxID=69370 RepID=UPI00285FC8DE|nr:hypothetical protein [Microbacterium trichothecenolyticum]MDR7187123.1 hypothetical protein [Microbacterium trichothecenolyticum]